MEPESRPWEPSGCTGGPHCPPRCPRCRDADGTPLTVRPLDLGDLPGLARMYRAFEAVDTSMGLPPLSDRGVDAWLVVLAATARNLVAVTDARRPLGHVTLAPATATEPELAAFVHPDAHGRGIGTELVKHAIAVAADAGRDAITLSVEASNAPALAVYRRLGFEIESTNAGIHAMRLELTEPIVDRVRRPPAATA